MEVIKMPNKRLIEYVKKSYEQKSKELMLVGDSKKGYKMSQRKTLKE
jgi:hypothetical protein